MSHSVLSIGIVGLPNVGKSTLFNALTKKQVPAENYPFCTIDPSTGTVEVPDDRLEKLATFSQSEKKINAIVEFKDIAGLIKGASSDEGMGNKFLSYIREVDAIAEVVRAFEDKDIHHVHGEINPEEDIATINLELMLADLQTVQKRRENIQKDLKRGDKEKVFEDTVLEKIEKKLTEGKKLLSEETKDWEEKDLLAIKSLHLLTMKPFLYVLNVSEANENNTNIKQKLGNSVVEIDPVFEKGLDDLIKKAYETLDLVTFFTTGKDETRGWTIKRDSTAPIAGTAIHTDFKDKFIRAEVIEWNKLLEAGSYASAREKGWLRIEGKDYIVQDGDVVEFKI